MTGQGEVLRVDDQEPDLLHAAQVALGLLGVMTEVELAVVPAYVLSERIEYHDYQDVIASWPRRSAGIAISPVSGCLQTTPRSSMDLKFRLADQWQTVATSRSTTRLSLTAW